MKKILILLILIISTVAYSKIVTLFTNTSTGDCVIAEGNLSVLSIAKRYSNCIMKQRVDGEEMMIGVICGNHGFMFFSSYEQCLANVKNLK